jgi:predicted kinase
MPVCYQLVGVPGVGKSTWVKNQTRLLGLTIVSTDYWVEQYAKSQDMTYSDVFEVAMPYAIEQMLEQVRLASKYNHSIVWDQTSTTIASRKKKFNMLPNYEHIAVVFITPLRGELDVRLSGRPGKHVPKNVVDSMIAGFQMPTLEEGFKEIVIVH